MSTQPNVIEIPKNNKIIACSGCGKEISVNPRVVMGFCAACSNQMGVKK